AHSGELHLDLVDGLLTEIPYIEEVGLGTPDQLTDAVDALALEAVVRPDGEVQLLDRQGQVGGQLRVLRRRADVDALGGLVQLAAEAEQLDEGRAGRRQRSAGRDGRLRLDVDDQAVEVGALLYTGRLDAVGHLHDRRVDRVDRDPADLGTGGLVLRRRDVATAPLDGELHVEPALAVERGQLQVGVVHGHAGRGLDVTGGDVARALLAQVHADRFVVLGADGELLDVHDQLDHILLDTGDRGELVQDAVDLDAGDRRARDGRQQGPAQRVTEGVAEARLQGLDGEPGAGLAERLFREARALADEHAILLSFGASAI